MYIQIQITAPEVMAKLEELKDLLLGIQLKERKMSEQLDQLKAEVERNSAVDQSAVVLIQGIVKKLDEAIAAGDPKALTELSTRLKNSTDALAAAVTANTPAEEPPAPTGEGQPVSPE